MNVVVEHYSNLSLNSNIEQNSSTDAGLWKALLAASSCQPDRNVKQLPSMQLIACWMTADQPETEIEGGADASHLCKWELQHHQADVCEGSQHWQHVQMSHSTKNIHILSPIIMIYFFTLSCVYVFDRLHCVPYLVSNNLLFWRGITILNEFKRQQLLF